MRLPTAPAADRAASVALLRHAVELGVELVDTAHMYGAGANEELVAEALHPYDGVLVATKVGIDLGDTPHGHAGPSTSYAVRGDRAFVRDQTETALRRLRTDRLDLLQLHRLDPEVPVAEQVGTLRELQREGKVARIGLSEVTVDELDQACADGPVDAVQNKYSVGDRTHEPVLRRCAELGTAFLPWRPVDAGDAGPALRAVAAEVGATPVQVALAWLLQRNDVVHPIPGTGSTRHLADNVAARDLRLTADQVSRLD